MDLSSLLKTKRQDILRLAEMHGAYNVRVFGSVARGEAGPESDVDVLINLKPDRSLMDHVAFLQDLEDLLGCKVHVVTEGGVHWYIKDRILKEAVPL